MSPRNQFLAVLDEARGVPDLESIEEHSNWEFSLEQNVSMGTAFIHPPALAVPSGAWTDLYVAVWMHEIGHLRTIPRDYPFYDGHTLKRFHLEVLAWKWARATMGDKWTPEVAHYAAVSLNTYRKARLDFKRRWRMFFGKSNFSA